MHIINLSKCAHFSEIYCPPNTIVNNKKEPAGSGFYITSFDCNSDHV